MYVSAVVACTAILAACGSGSGSGSEPAASVIDTPSESTSASNLPDLTGTTLTVFMFSPPVKGTNVGALQESIFAPFEQATGAKIVVDEPVDYAKVDAQIKANNVSYDLVDGDDGVWAAGCGASWEKMDGVDTSTLFEGATATISDCSAPNYGYQYLMVYRKSSFPDAPPSCADFFDTAQAPGKRGVFAYSLAGQLECSAIAQGADATNPYPLDIAVTTGKFEEIKSDLLIYNTSIEALDQIVNGDTTVGIYPSGQALTGVTQNPEYAIVPNFSIDAFGSFGIPKGSKNVEAAKALLNYLYLPESQQRYAEALKENGVPYCSVVAPISCPDNPLVPPLGNGTAIDWTWWSTNYVEATDALNAAFTG